MEQNNNPPIICDTGPLIHLDELDSSDLLSDFPVCYIPQAVRAEVLYHRPEVLSRSDIKFVSPETSNLDSPMLEALISAFELHHGEREALALALDYPESLFLTDDTPARLAAKSLGITVHGSLGILIRSIRRGLRTKEQVLQTLQSISEKSSLHLRPSLLQQVIDTVSASTTVQRTSAEENN